MVRKSAWLVIVVLIATACLEEPDCYQLNNEVIGIAFKKLENSSADTVTFGLQIVEPHLIFADTTLSRLFFPLNYFRDETTFVFAQESAVDTLQLTYLSQAQFVSEDCGEKFVLSKLRVGHHSFDSVRLVIDTPTQNGSVINLEIFQ